MSIFKGATELYFMHYSRVVIILLSTGLYKSAFSTYSFGKARFSSFSILVFHVPISLVFIFPVLCFEFNVISKDLITFFNFVLTLFKQSVKYKNRFIKKHASREVYL